MKNGISYNYVKTFWIKYQTEKLFKRFDGISRDLKCFKFQINRYWKEMYKTAIPCNFHWKSNLLIFGDTIFDSIISDLQQKCME